MNDQAVETREPVATGARVLVVDDEPSILRVIERVLRARGHEVETFNDGEAAIKRVPGGGFDVVITDISMPQMDGIELLRRVREHDLDVPVVLVTGAPAIGTAIRAIEYGAFRYLTKPFQLDELESIVVRASRLHQIARAKRTALEMFGHSELMVGDRAGLEAQLSRALESLWVAFQPIVRPDGSLFGYEAFLRFDESCLPDPSAVVDAAERLGRVEELGRMVRVRAAAAMANAPADALLFVNVHPAELGDSELISPQSPLGRIAPRVVLEVTERAKLDGAGDISHHVTSLREQGFRIAVDDVGAGYAGLASFALLEPDIMKLDTTLVRGVDRDEKRRRVVRTMAELGRDLKMEVVAEGVETDSERAVLSTLGCSLMQGYFFARPSRTFPPLAG